ncbi:MAG: FxLYD domain-containing protein [Methanobacterium sp. ERen5]|nr:MAG: FxLYD domain-containing protein [Methanobacterium sp. ERen5]
MNVKILGVIGFILIIGVVMVSGCTSSNGDNNISSNYTISEANTPGVTSDNGMLSIGGLIKNTGTDNYQNVKLNIQGYDDNGTLVFQKNQTIAQLNAGSTADYSVIEDWNGKTVSYAKIVVINATKV